MRTARKSITSYRAIRGRAKRTRSLILVRISCLQRCAAINTTSPKQEGTAGTSSGEVWIVTDGCIVLLLQVPARIGVSSISTPNTHVLLGVWYALDPVGEGCSSSAMRERSVQRQAWASHRSGLRK